MTKHKREKHDRLPKKAIRKRVTSALDRRHIEYKFKKKNQIWMNTVEYGIPQMTNIWVTNDAVIIMTLIDREMDPESIDELFPLINEVNKGLKYGKFFYSEDLNGVLFEYSYLYLESDASKKLIDSILKMVFSTVADRIEKFEPYFGEEDDSSDDGEEDDSSDDEDEEELTSEEAAAGLSALFG